MPRGASPNAGANAGALSSALDDVTQGVKTTANQFAQNTAKGLGIWGQTAQSIAKTPLRIGASLVDVPRTINGQQPLKPFNVPGLGTVSSYARQAVDNSSNPTSMFYNKPILSGVNAASQGILDTALTGMVAKGAVNEPGGFGYDPSKGSYGSVGQAGQRNASGGLNLLDDSNQTFNPTQPLYRGEGASNTGGLHFTPNKAWASNFGDHTISGTLPPNAKVYNLTGADMEGAFNKGITNEGDLWKGIFNQGYDAIKGTDSMNSKALDIIVNPALRNSFKGAAAAPLGAALGERLSPRTNARQKTATSTQSRYGQ